MKASVLRRELAKYRIAASPAMRKWESFEDSSTVLCAATASLLVLLVLLDRFNSLMFLGGAVAGLLVVSAYIALMRERVGLALVVALVAVTIGAAVGFMYRPTFPLWVIWTNTLSGVVAVVGTAAVLTRKIGLDTHPDLFAKRVVNHPGPDS